ncbi:hypothetical protein QO002_002771 [Pararhizobium capsulatum DSM 1112]|uniref:CsbD family protein n=1 Tax=Pararhizobium capsulatum DSM 1112 TaxID=1121113 RepID=A0ABU0BRQ4_9HYPH|nr:hypothetical protein [Pararhizobium capsulatum]MDQ0320633.1 hypothetical protein [Pararhizobium capsulatum DSM 1112]
MANVRNIRTGFTGELADKDSVAHRAKEAASYVRNEANAVARGVQGHPSATGTAVLLVGAAAFLAGYLMGSSSAPPPRTRFW